MIGNDSNDTVPQNDAGELRVFVMYDAREMQTARDLLVRDVFPEIARVCSGRGLEFTHVDLRRGVGRTFNHQAKLLRLSLDELRRNRPYVIGLVGAHYGWTRTQPLTEAQAAALGPYADFASLIDDGRSTFDIEIETGVLGHQDVKERSHFYICDRHVGEPDIEPDTDEQASVESLRSRIRASGARMREDVASTEALTSWVREDLLSIVNRLAPEGTTLSAIELERRAHETFAASRRQAYVANAAVTEQIERGVASDEPPLVICGEAGVGKSALVAHWSAEYRRRHPSAFVVTHYVGAVSSAGTRAELLRRVMLEIRDRLDEKEEVPVGLDALEEAFPFWLAKGAGAGLILIVDGLGQLEEGSRELEWLPQHLPLGVRLVLTSASVPMRAQRDRWPVLRLEPLSVNERLAIGRQYIAQQGSAVPADRVLSVAADDASSNPLFLRTRLEELRLFGSYERKGRNLEGYLDAGSLEELFDRVIERLEDRFGEQPLRHVLCAIWCSRYGMAEHELEHSAGCTPLELAELLGAVDYHLLRTDGRLRFYHDALRRAVQRRYLGAEDDRRSFYATLAAFFAEQPAGRRRAEELPWLLLNAADTSAMRSAVGTLDVLMPFVEDDRGYELLGYWLEAEAHDEIVPAYSAALEAYEHAGPAPHDLARVLRGVGEFFRLSGGFEAALFVMRRAAALQEQLFGEEHVETAATLYALGDLLHESGNTDEAEICYRRVLAIQERTLGADHPVTARTLGSIAAVLREQSDFDASEELYRRALRIVERFDGDPYLSTAINNLGGILHDKGDYAAAESLFRRALAVCESTFGPDHPNTGVTANNLAAVLYDKGADAGAEEVFQRVVETTERALGPVHPMVGSVLCNWAGFLAREQPARALPLMERALAIHEQAFAEANVETAIILYSLGRIRYYMGDLDAAERYLRRAYDLQCAIIGEGHPDAAVTMSGLAMVYRDRNDLWVADRMLRRAIEMLEASVGAHHPHVGVQLGNLAELARRRGDLAAARQLARRSLAILGVGDDSKQRKALEVQALLQEIDG